MFSCFSGQERDRCRNFAAPRLRMRFFFFFFTADTLSSLSEKDAGNVLFSARLA